MLKTWPCEGCRGVLHSPAHILIFDGVPISVYLVVRLMRVQHFGLIGVHCIIACIRLHCNVACIIYFGLIKVYCVVACIILSCWCTSFTKDAWQCMPAKKTTVDDSSHASYWTVCCPCQQTPDVAGQNVLIRMWTTMVPIVALLEGKTMQSIFWQSTAWHQ